MVDLREVLQEEPEFPELLEPVRLGPLPTALLLFTPDAEEVSLHFVADQAVRSYVPCPGDECPLCYCGVRPSPAFLLPVISIQRRCVQVLRVAQRRGPGSLFTMLAPHLGEEDMANKLYLIRRDGGRYLVETQDLGERADRCDRVITGFLKAREEGLRLTSAFPSYTSEELAEVEEVKRFLDAVGGWSAPGRSDA